MKLFNKNCATHFSGTFILSGLLFLFAISACNNTKYATQQNPGKAELSDANQQPASYGFSIFLIGDAGDAVLQPRSDILNVLGRELSKVNGEGAIIFLGDNIYPDGLPPENSENRAEAEEKMLAQIETVKDFEGPVYFIPGNHDWESSGENGLEYINRQEEFVEKHMGRGNVFLPDYGEAGPVSIILSDKDSSETLNYTIGLVIMDTQWWLHPYEKPYPGDSETTEQAREQIMANLSDQLSDLKEDEVIFAAHHPLYTFGRHGNKFPLKTHLVPPVFGSIYALYRNIWGYTQDINHKHYSKMKEGILSAADENQNLIFAGGHEHSLQFIPVIENNSQYHQIVSGSATRSSYVRKQRGPVYTFENEGFAVIHYYPDRSKKVEFFTETGEKVFDQIIFPD